MRTELLSRNAKSKASVIDAQESYQPQQTTLASQKGQLGEAPAGVLMAQRDIEKTFAAFIADNAQNLAEAARQIDDDRQKLQKARVKTSHMKLVSPLDGLVQGLTVTTMGAGPVGRRAGHADRAGRERARDRMIHAERRSGFVKPGQPAVVKIGSFPFTDYGTIGDHVIRDAIPQVEAEQREETPVQSYKAAMFGGAQRMQNLVFPVALALDKTTVSVDGGDVASTTGMTVTMKIKSGTRRILSYIFSSLLETLSIAMKEGSGQQSSPTKIPVCATIGCQSNRARVLVFNERPAWPHSVRAAIVSIARNIGWNRRACSRCRPRQYQSGQVDAAQQSRAEEPP